VVITISDGHSAPYSGHKCPHARRHTSEVRSPQATSSNLNPPLSQRGYPLCTLVQSIPSHRDAWRSKHNIQTHH